VLDWLPVDPSGVEPSVVDSSCVPSLSVDVVEPVPVVIPVSQVPMPVFEPMLVDWHGGAGPGVGVGAGHVTGNCSVAPRR
jgi:hypothetical protein